MATVETRSHPSPVLPASALREVGTKKATRCRSQRSHGHLWPRRWQASWNVQEPAAHERPEGDAAPALAPQGPYGLCRSPAAKTLVRSESVAGKIMAAPRPTTCARPDQLARGWHTRRPRSPGRMSASPASNVPLRPQRSERRL